MVWTNPRTWVARESPSAAVFNTHVRDNLNHLYAAIMPVGAIIPYAGGSAPGGFLLADGAVVSRTTYAALFTVCGTSYNVGGEAGTDFRLPNLKGRVPVGLNSADAEFDALGEAGGAKSVALSEAQLANHYHYAGHDHSAGTGYESADHAHSWGNWSGGHNADHSHGQMHSNLGAWVASGTGRDPEGYTGGWGRGTTGASNDHSHYTSGGTSGINANHAHGVTVYTNSFNTDARGSGSAHSNIQPYQTINYIIKT